MRFEHPAILWYLLLALPALTAFFWWSWQKRRELIAQFVQSRLLAQLTVGVSAARQKARLALLVASVALLVFILARPQWGYDWEEARQRGLDIVVAIDTSRSMLADDIKPNRLERAKLAALDLIKLARSDRLGLVAFAGSAFLQCPLTLDDEPFRQSVNALDVNIIPQGGTAVAEAIQCALGAFKEKSDNHKILVLFTDGEDHDLQGGALDAARSAAKEGLRIFTIGVGTPKGELVRVRDDQGRADFLKDDQGNAVMSRLNEALLRDLAKAANGFYVLLSGADTMDLLYERGLAPLPKAEFSAQRVKRWHERYQWFLGLVIVLLLVEMFLPERKRGRRSEEILAGTTNEELRKAVALLLALLLPAAALASSPSSAKKKYDAGRYDSALWDYQRLLKEKPDDPRLQYNAGAAAYQSRDYQEALKHLQSTLATPDLALQQRAYYNLGNALYRLGERATEPQAKQQQWQQAVGSYESALRLDPKDEDARHNLELVKKKLEELKQQQQQQQQQQQNKDDQQDQDKQDQQKEQQQQQQTQPQDQQKQGAQDQQHQPQQQESQQPNQTQPKPDQPQPAESRESGEKPEEQPAEPGSTRPLQMTPQEAQRLLDATKGEEKTIIFVPPRTNRLDRVFKNW